MEQGLLVVSDAVGILDHERRPPHPSHRGTDITSGLRRERLRSRQRLPYAGEMRLAAGFWADQELHVVLPIGPGVDQPDRREIAIADEEILRAKRRAMGQVERELSDRHEALIRERCGCSRPGACRWRGGSGLGAGS